jgi:uncharacterized protein involved in tolerance to divalent cations
MLFLVSIKSVLIYIFFIFFFVVYFILSKTVSEELLNEKSIACVNIFPEATS